MKQLKKKAATKPKASTKPKRPAEYDDDEPAATKTKTKKSKSSAADDAAVDGGWGASDRENAKSATYVMRIKLEPESTLVKFLSGAPVFAFAEHWIQELKGKGKMSFMCMRSMRNPKTGDHYESCPLCDDLGHKPDPKHVFPVAVLNKSDKPELRALTCSPTLVKLVRSVNDDKRKGPVDRHYYDMTQTGGGNKGPVQYGMALVKERDLEDDWDVKPLTEKTAAKLLEKFTSDDVLGKLPTKQQLKELAASLTGEEAWDEDEEDD